jgi:hypothetical protein
MTLKDQHRYRGKPVFVDWNLEGTDCEEWYYKDSDHPDFIGKPIIFIGVSTPFPIPKRTQKKLETLKERGVSRVLITKNVTYNLEWEIPKRRDD